MRRDGRSTCAIGPEAPTCFSTHRNKALRLTGISHAYYFRGGFGDMIFFITGNIDQQHHLGQIAAWRLGSVVDGPHITFVQVFHPGQLHISQVIQIVLGFHYRRHRAA